MEQIREENAHRYFLNSVLSSARFVLRNRFGGAFLIRRVSPRVLHPRIAVCHQTDSGDRFSSGHSAGEPAPGPVSIGSDRFIDLPTDRPGHLRLPQTVFRIGVVPRQHGAWDVAIRPRDWPGGPDRLYQLVGTVAGSGGWGLLRAGSIPGVVSVAAACHCLHCDRYAFLDGASSLRKACPVRGECVGHDS